MLKIPLKNKSRFTAEKFPSIFHSNALTTILLCFCYQTLMALATFAFKEVLLFAPTFIVISLRFQSMNNKQVHNAL
jgi:hypothetical protein